MEGYNLVRTGRDNLEKDGLRHLLGQIAQMTDELVRFGQRRSRAHDIAARVNDDGRMSFGRIVSLQLDLWVWM